MVGFFSGYIEMSQKDLDTILSYNDPYTGLVYSISMGYVEANNLEFDLPD
jgi:hypothetical protein